MTPQSIHSILVAEAATKNLPEAYQNDLHKHDLDQLVLTGSQEFFWVLRTCGTHIFTLDDAPGKRADHLLAETTKGVIGDAVVLWYHFANGELKPITLADAKEIVARKLAERAKVSSYRAY